MTPQEFHEQFQSLEGCAKIHERSERRLQWVIGILITIAIFAGGLFAASLVREAAEATTQAAVDATQTEKIASQERALEKIDQKLDRILSWMESKP